MSSSPTTCSGLFNASSALFLLRTHAFEEFVALWALQGTRQGALLFGRHVQDFLHAFIRRPIEKFLRFQIRVQLVFALLRLLVINRGVLGRRSRISVVGRPGRA